MATGLKLGSLEVGRVMVNGPYNGRNTNLATNMPWVRPAEWIALPAAPAQGVSALYGVENSDGNYVAVICTTVSGSYTVDWGDGNTTTVASNVVAEHLYDYSAITTALTVDGMKQVVVTITGNMKTIDFNKRHSRPGLVAAMAVNWLEVNIQGASITSILFSGSTENIQCKYLERVNIGTVGTITNTTNMFTSCVSLQSVPLFNTASVMSMQGMFTNCYSLQSVPLFNTAAVTTMYAMFHSCYSLQSVPLFNTASVTNMSNMFNSCGSLQSCPAFDLGYNINKDRAPTLTIYNWTLGAGWTYGTNTLVKGSAGTGTALALNPQSASITGDASTDIITATNHGFQAGDKIQFSAITGGAGLNTSAIYKVSATSLATSTFKVTDLNDVAIDFTTNITSGTVGRWNIAIVAATLYKVTIVVSELTAGTATYTLGGTAGTTISAAGTHIDYITTATAVKLTISPTDDARFIISSIKIEEVENMLSMFSGCRSLGKSDMVGLRHSVSYTSCKLSRAGIVNIFNNLGVAAISSPTAGYDIIDISSNHGTVDLTADDRLIATAAPKNWTITG